MDPFKNVASSIILHKNQEGRTNNIKNIKNMQKLKCYLEFHTFFIVRFVVFFSILKYTFYIERTKFFSEFVSCYGALHMILHLFIMRMRQGLVHRPMRILLHKGQKEVVVETIVKRGQTTKVCCL